MSDSIINAKGILSYPYVFEPNKDGKFEATVLIDKGDEKTKRALDLAVKAAREEGMKRVWKGIAPAGNFWSPVKDGDGTRESGTPFGEECRGKWVLRASSKIRPVVVDRDKRPLEDPSEIYGGCVAVALVSLFPYSMNGRKGVAARLEGVLKIKDGPRFGRSGGDVFANVNVSDFLDDDDDLF